MLRRLRNGLLLVAVALVAGTQSATRAEDAAVLKDRKSVRVIVKFFDVTSAGLEKVEKNIPAGDGHDALLMAGLIKRGARPIDTSDILTLDGVEATAGTSKEINCVGTEGRRGVMKIMNGVEATPHCNANGTIKCDLKIIRQSLDALPKPSTTSVPSVTTTQMSTTMTCRDGKTRILPSQLPAAGAKSKVHLIFVKMAVIDRKS